MRESWAARLGWAALQIGIVAFCWWQFKLFNVLPIGLIATIVVSTLAPPRWSNVVSGVGLIATAVALNVAYGATQIPGLLGVVGVIFLGLGAYSLWTTRRAGGNVDAA